MTALRPYQEAAIQGLRDAVSGGAKAPLLVAPTGSGKTVMAAAIIKNAVAFGQSVLFLAHRRELIEQTCRKLYAVGVEAGVILAGHPPQPSARVQVASIQTLASRALRGSALTLPPAGIVLIDEAHHAIAATYRKIVDAYPDATIIGLTATPCRGDGRGLGGVFDALIEAPDIASLTTAGFLVPAKVYAPDRPDLTGVRTARGDYVEAQAAAAVDKPKLVGSIAEHWGRLAHGRRTVLFAAGVRHSLHCRDELRRVGAMAEHIDGSTPLDERESILAGLARGTVDIVCNAQVLTEGWDCPETACAILARPTKSVVLFRQMIGRVLRPAPGKADALILDHAGAVFEHGLPDEPIVWTLDPDKRAESPRQTARQHGQAPGLLDCPECRAVRMAGKPCAVCGWTPRKRAESFETADGLLGEVAKGRKRKPGELSDADKARWHRQLSSIGQDRGYKHGWASVKYREKFGAWPRTRWATPEPPDADVLGWVRSRQIAYAKGMERRRAG